MPVLAPEDAGITDAQQLMMLPFEMMRQYMEDVMFEQLEIATRLYFRQAKELDSILMMHFDTLLKLS